MAPNLDDPDGLVNLRNLTQEVERIAPDDKSVPIVLVPGFLGWGAPLFGTVNYFGGVIDIPKILVDRGYTVIVASVSPISSNWERACELYSKGYSVTGTTKIIHRYLPSNVGELLLYYVWLIVPFLSQLPQLVKIPGFKQGSTPYLWGEFSISQLLPSENTKVQTLPYLQANDKEARKERKKASRILQKLTNEKAETDSVTAGVSDGPWSATRLSVALSRTFKLSFGTETNIQMWRHAAIAISRRHLQQAKFKRDFIEAVSWAWNDEMAAHSTKIAGLTYARGLEEAPGHIAGAKAEYRRISREWHAWLGFGGFRNSAI